MKLVLDNIRNFARYILVRLHNLILPRFSIFIKVEIYYICASKNIYIYFSIIIIYGINNF